MGQQQPSSGGAATSSSAPSGGSSITSGQTHATVRAPARRVFSVWTCCKLSLASFAVGAVVGYTQKRWVNKLLKRRLRQWVSRYLKRRLRRWVTRLLRPPLRRWAAGLLRRLKKS